MITFDQRTIFDLAFSQIIRRYGRRLLSLITILIVPLITLSKPVISALIFVLVIICFSILSSKKNFFFKYFIIQRRLSSAFKKLVFKLNLHYHYLILLNKIKYNYLGVKYQLQLRRLVYKDINEIKIFIKGVKNIYPDLDIPKGTLKVSLKPLEKVSIKKHDKENFLIKSKRLMEIHVIALSITYQVIDKLIHQYIEIIAFLKKHDIKMSKGSANKVGSLNKLLEESNRHVLTNMDSVISTSSKYVKKETNLPTKFLTINSAIKYELSNLIEEITKATAFSVVELTERIENTKRKIFELDKNLNEFINLDY